MSNDKALKERLCPHCGQYHPIEARFCPITGKSLPPLILTCPNCGQDVKVEWLRCPYCAAFLQSTESDDPRSRWRLPSLNLLLVSLIILGFGGVIFGMVLISKNNNAPSLAFTPQVDESISQMSNNPAAQATPLFLTAASTTPTHIPSSPSKTPTSPSPIPTRTISPSRTLKPTQKPTIIPTEGPWEACPGSSLSYLHVNDRAYISFDPPLPNRVRSKPNTDGTIIGHIQPGEEVKIINGPACGNGWVWWYVRSKETGLTGWTAEGDDKDYWLLPFVKREVNCPQNRDLKCPLFRE
jgi:hypothetical protein